MPNVVSCPRCRKAVSLGLLDAGRTIVCPACGQSFLAPGEAVAARREPERAATSSLCTLPTQSSSTQPLVSMQSAHSRTHWQWVVAAGIVVCALMFLAIHSLVSGRSASPIPVTLTGAEPANSVQPVMKPLPAPQAFNTPATRAASASAAPLLTEANIQKNQLAQIATRPSTMPRLVADAAGTEPHLPTTAPVAAFEDSFPLPNSSDTRPAATSGPASRPIVATTGPATQPVALRPKLKPIPPPKEALTDEMIEASIQRGVRYLMSRFPGDPQEMAWILEGARYVQGPLAGHPGNATACGKDALAVYALMQAGLALHDSRLSGTGPPMRRMIDQLKRLPVNSGNITYSRALRATALSVFNRKEDRQCLFQDVKYLAQNQQGSYTYEGGSAKIWDNSNSQYGLLGVWSGADAGIEIPLEYWQKVDEHWASCQLADGEWPYKAFELGENQPPPPSTGTPDLKKKFATGKPRSTMTAAGIVSLIITHDYLDLPRFVGDVGREPFTPALRKGLEWWEDGDNYLSQVDRVASLGYVVFGIERVGLASGFKHFGSHEWYREMAIQLIDRQLKNGSWGDDLDTSYILIFLSRGRHPVMMNKLRFDNVPNVNNHYWANRPRDTANLARWTGRELERPVNWQVVRLDHDWVDWSDAPILYLASHRRLEFADHDYDNFRNFVQAGGMIFTQADGDSISYDDWIPEFAHKLFPQYELQDVPPTHPLYSVNFPLHGRPKLKMVSNGSRILLLYSPKDIARWWQTRDDKIHPDYFRLGANMFLYAGGKRDWRNKLQTTFVADPGLKPIATFGVMRLKYTGNWDPEPAAWPRLGRMFQYRTGYGIDVQSCNWADLTPDSAALAHLTGTAAYDPSPREIAAMQKYVRTGGVLLVDSCGGSDPFAHSMRQAVAQAFRDSKFELVVPSHPLLNAGPPGMLDLTQRHVRLQVSSTLGNQYGGFEILSAGKGHVIFSALDLTSGLLGTDTWGIWGYTPDYSQQFVQNAILWTWDGQKER